MLTPEDLERGGFTTVILAAPDFHGRLFGKRIPAHRFRTALEEFPAVCTCALTYDVTQMNQSEPLPIPFAGYHTGWNDFRLRADLSTLRQFPGAPDTAVCLADLVDDEGEPLEIAPRALLRRQVQRAEAAGYQVLIGSELEFYVFYEDLRTARRNGFRDLEPTTLVHSDHRIYGQAGLEPFMARLRSSLEESGISVFASQAEHGLGQWEINLDYCSALEMADRHVIYKEGAKELALREGLSLTFMALPLSDEIGSSCHLHCSLRSPDETPVFADVQDGRRLSGPGRAFLAGLMDHLDETTLLFAPYVNSYKRHAVPFSGAVNAWGSDNRTLAFRVVGAGPSLRIEHRFPGADANPYLAIAAVIGAGLDGIERELDPGAPIAGNAYQHPELPRPPASLGEAIDAFERSDFAAGAFGKEASRNYAAHARHEWSAYLRELTDWEVRRAFELA